MTDVLVEYHFPASYYEKIYTLLFLCLEKSNENGRSNKNDKISMFRKWEESFKQIVKNISRKIGPNIFY